MHLVKKKLLIILNVEQVTFARKLFQVNLWQPDRIMCLVVMDSFSFKLERLNFLKL